MILYHYLEQKHKHTNKLAQQASEPNDDGLLHLFWHKQDNPLDVIYDWLGACVSALET